MGVGHCGTTILRRILGTHDNITEIHKEMFPLDKHLNDDDLYVYKKPIYTIELLKKLINYHTKVKIIHIYRSLKNIKQSILKRNTTIYNFDELPFVYDKLCNGPYYQISYNTLIENPYNTVKTLCNFLDIQFYNNMLYYFENVCLISNKGNIHEKIATDKPDDTDHESYRLWQINQPLFNFQ